jgi:glutathione S-transferase
MQLIGMLDSPYVRRTAISLRLLGIPFEHRPVSVFSTFETFQKINPVVKAPTLVCDDGTVLMDSTLILDYAEALAPGRKLMPSIVKQRQQELRVLGVALAACEKAVQIVYERNLRPAEKQHEPWLTRIRGQLLAAFAQLETEVRTKPLDASSKNISQAGVTSAVVWQFTQSMVADIVNSKNYPALHAFSQRAEQLPEFLAAPPDGPGVPSR